MKLELHTSDGRGGRIKYDLSGLLVFLLSLLLLPMFLVNFGFGLASVTLIIISLLGVGHFVGSFLHRIWPSIKEDLRKDKERSKESEG